MENRETSLRRGVEVLALLGSDAAPPEGLGVTRIAQLTGYEKSQISRTLRVLEEADLVQRIAGGRGFRLGWGCFALVSRAGEPRLLELAGPALQSLVARFEETAHLSVLRGREVLTLLTEFPAHALAARGWAGRTVPVYCTSSGRALLFDHDGAALRSTFGDAGFPAAGPTASRDLAELERRLDEDRRRGYARVVEEQEPGLVAVAAPIRDFAGRVVAALNMSGPQFRFGRQLDNAGRLLAQTAGNLSSQLGARDAPRLVELAE